MVRGASLLAEIGWRHDAAFASAEEAWFWTMRALQARHEGATGRGCGLPRPFEPDDVMHCVDMLYRTRQMSLQHARILGEWGRQQYAPVPGGMNREDYVIWREALDLLAPPLRRKGIIV